MDADIGLELGHGAQHKSESLDIGRAWEDEAEQLPIMLGNVQSKNEQSYTLEELLQLQVVKDTADIFQICHKHWHWQKSDKVGVLLTIFSELFPEKALGYCPPSKKKPNNSVTELLDNGTEETLIIMEKRTVKHTGCIHFLHTEYL